MAVEIDINQLKEQFFVFNEPVPYLLKCGAIIEIRPVKLMDSAVFMSSCGILEIDKNSCNDIEVIQMSYLKYLGTKVCTTNPTQQQLINICLLCLGFTIPDFYIDEKGKAFLLNYDKEQNLLWRISAKEFDDLKKIILYQNFPHYDDSYINPDLKKAMDEQDALKNKNIERPSLERRMGIISAHTGITWQEQKTMTLREHTILFEEVHGEVEYLALKGASCFGKEGDKVQWVYKKVKGKFDDYITSVEDYNKSMGGDGKVNTIHSGEGLPSQFDKFIGGK